MERRKRYSCGVTVTMLKKVIRGLPDKKRTALASWMVRLDRTAWNEQITRDFAPGGAGIALLKEIDAQIAMGRFKPL